ncbi:SSH4 protein [Spatholobus suberectus]|nr:SSH4 protein [Spatholobus suberectus]
MGLVIHVAVVAASLGCVSALLLVFMWRLCHHKKKHRNFVEAKSLTRMESLQAGIARLHHQPVIHHQFDHKSKNKGNFYVFHNGVSKRGHLFNWDDHPYLVVDAVEYGWSRFAFTNYKSNMPSPSKRSTLLGACAAGEYGRETEAEISWEVCNGSAEYMQMIRLNPGLKKVLHTNNPSMMSVASIIRTALPLPGPPLGNYAFPQEAYFEITILCSRVDDREPVGKREGEKTKLLIIEDSSNGIGGLDMGEERKLDHEDGGGKSGSVMFSLGLTAGGGVPLRVPGSYPRSIGFNSNGSVFLEGMKLVMESEKAQWVRTDRVIGCGFDPRQKKVFFTLDSDLVHVIHCQSEEFATPLCPTLAANIDILVLVNFGQSAFKYAPANAQRTPNPCFIAPLVNSPGATLGYDDSKELFSTGRIDSQWLNRSAAKGNHNNGNNAEALDFDESETDLFEIVLDGSEKSQNTVS